MRGLDKKKTKKGVDIDGVAARESVGKGRDYDKVKRVGTPPPMHKRPVQKPPKSSATVSDMEGGYSKKENTMAMSRQKNQKLEDTMKGKKRHEESSAEESSDEVSKSLSGLGGFGTFFKKGEEVEAAAEQEDDAEEEEAVDDEVEKGEEGADADEDELEADSEEEDETNKSEGEVDTIPCPHCASDITADEVREAVANVQKSKKGGKAIPARTAAKEEQEGFTSGKKNKGGKLGGNKSATRGVHGVSRQNNAGNAGSYAKSQFGNSPLMTLSKSEGPGSDEEIAKELARRAGLDPDKLPA